MIRFGAHTQTPASRDVVRPVVLGVRRARSDEVGVGDRARCAISIACALDRDRRCRAGPGVSYQFTTRPASSMRCRSCSRVSCPGASIAIDIDPADQRVAQRALADVRERPSTTTRRRIDQATGESPRCAPRRRRRGSARPPNDAAGREARSIASGLAGARERVAASARSTRVRRFGVAHFDIVSTSIHDRDTCNSSSAVAHAAASTRGPPCGMICATSSAMRPRNERRRRSPATSTSRMAADRPRHDSPVNCARARSPRRHPWSCTIRDRAGTRSAPSRVARLGLVLTSASVVRISCERPDARTTRCPWSDELRDDACR